ncbi:3'-5' exonuclease [Flavisolibacter ginsenosidimutans]|uniref:3'-5' exonuclease n=1 Tax=Flavisolibacter ginsenosidimutans TaxID=661481 RepID=A0A5B8UKX3_9BACT|nr:3'-5' exonuclease [Flavisolibacter ginsenosidimutans]QEC57022.1 3'-5' exonuclease [Flavisolibacter ginsenosidimutans]
MNFNNILFLDIETVSQEESYHQLDSEWKDLWNHKTRSLTKNPETDTPELLYPRAAIYAEFGKIICVSCGCIQGTGEEKKLVIKSYSGDDEKKLLKDFANMLQGWSGQADKFLCAHNGKEFDYPYLCRRMIVNGVEIPEALKISGRKPWEVRHLDTLELWKFGDFKSYTSLKLLAKVLGVPSPKDDIDGSMVNEVYYVQKDLERIVEYCQKDVITLAQILLRFHCETLVKPANIEIKNLRKADV